MGYGLRLGYVVAGMEDAIYGKRLPTGGIALSVSGNLMLGPTERTRSAGR